MRIFSVILLAAWMLCGTALAQTGYTPLGKTLLVGTNGVVTQPEGFWTNNVLGVGDITVDTDAQGRMRISLTVGTNTALSVYWDAILDIPDVLADIPALTNILAQAVAAFDWGDHAAVGYIASSTTAVAYTNAGGSYTTNAVVATSGLLANGVASVAADKTGQLSLLWEISTNSTDWVTYAQTNGAAYVRLSVENNPPGVGDLTTTVSNITVSSWTRPDLYGETSDTAGQIIHVDTATEPRQPVPLSQMQSAVAAVNAADWSQYPATETVYMDGNKLLLGSGWSIIETEGVGVVSYADLITGTNGLIIANNGTPAITCVPGLAGLTINTFTVDGGTGTVGVATNGCDSIPLMQWTASLTAIDWQTLTPVSETYPSTNAAGDYEIVAVLPEGAQGFVRAVRETGAAAITLHADTTVDGTNTATAFVQNTTNLLDEIVKVEGVADTAWQNPASATNFTWTTNAALTEITLASWLGTGGNDVVIPDHIDGLPVTVIGTNAFANGSVRALITSVSGGVNVRTVRREAFYICNNLTNAVLPSVTSLGIGVFAFTKLASYDMPALINVGANAFSDTKFQSVELLSATQLDAFAFEVCDDLTDVYLPNVKIVGSQVFRSSPLLTGVYWGQDQPSGGEDIYSGITANQVTNYVTNPTATGWGDTFGGMPVVRLGITAESYAYPSNRRAIASATAIGTNATYEIASANGFRQVLDFGTDTNAFEFTFEGPGSGFEAATHLTVFNYDKRPTTWPTNNVVWVPADDFPTNATMNVVIQWFNPTNVTEQITILNTTWDN